MDPDGSGDIGKDESGDVEVEPEIEVEITVLAKGDTFVYTALSFPVYKPTLQQVKLQLEESSGEVKVLMDLQSGAIYWISLCPQLRR